MFWNQKQLVYQVVLVTAKETEKSHISDQFKTRQHVLIFPPDEMLDDRGG